MGLRGVISIASPKSPIYDFNAQTFITAAGITDTTQKNAVNQLVLDLKAANIWTKMKALYPVVGGTASTHKWNLKDPLDTNAAFRLTFTTGWTHSSTGMTPNGTSAYAQTNLLPSSVLSLNSTHLSYYSRTASGTGATGSQRSGASDGIQLATGPTVFGGRVNNATYSGNFSITNTAAFLLANRISSATISFFRNNTKFTSSIVSTLLPNQNILFGAYNNNGVITNYDNKEVAFASIGDGLSDSEALAFYNAVQTFQTTLGRQV